MPTYDYECRECRKSFEAEQKLTDPPLAVCERCGSASVKRVIAAAPVFVLKGTGWYKDGYK